MNSRYPKIEVSFGRAFICRSSFRNVLIRNTFQTCSGCIFTEFTQNCIIINFLINIFFVNIGKIFTWDFDKFKRLSSTLENDTLVSDFHLNSHLNPQVVRGDSGVPLCLSNFLEDILQPTSFKMSPTSNSGL